MKMEFQINKGNSYNTLENKATFVQNKKAIEHYFDHLNAALSLEKNIPIFLDTNIFLRYYSRSSKQKELLHHFLLKRKEQILISRQVELEFVKNRKGVRERHLQITLGKKKRSLKDTGLILVPEFKSLDNLKNEEIKFLKEEFDSMRNEIDPQKIKSEIKKSNKVFPGIGDISDKTSNSYGDYILFHEMIKYAKRHQEDVVFLTFDSTKGDWLNFNKEPNIHYIQRVYEITSKSIFIIDAHEFFENFFSISLDDSLVINPSKGDDNFTELNLAKEINLDFFSLQRIVRLIAAYLKIDVNGRKSFNQTIRLLYDDDLISEVIFHELRRISHLRNHLINGGNAGNAARFTRIELQTSLKLSLIHI